MKGKTLRQYDNPVKPDTLPSRPFSASTPGSQDRLTQDKAIYKVVVKTGNQHNCGTDAEVITVQRTLKSRIFSLSYPNYRNCHMVAPVVNWPSQNTPH